MNMMKGSSWGWTPRFWYPNLPAFSSREGLLLHWGQAHPVPFCYAYCWVQSHLEKNPVVVWMWFIPQEFVFWELGPLCGGAKVVHGNFKRQDLVGGSSVIDVPLWMS